MQPVDIIVNSKLNMVFQMKHGLSKKFANIIN